MCSCYVLPRCEKTVSIMKNIHTPILFMFPKLISVNLITKAFCMFMKLKCEISYRSI